MLRFNLNAEQNIYKIKRPYMVIMNIIEMILITRITDDIYIYYVIIAV